MIEWDPAFRRDLDSTNWQEAEIRQKFSHYLADFAQLSVGRGYLKLVEEFLGYVDHHAIPLILMTAREERAHLDLVYEIIGLVEEGVEQDLEELAGDLTVRSRITCERCGEPGQPQVIRGSINAHKTLCSTCQRMYDDAVFFDEAIPDIVTAIREYVADYRGTFADPRQGCRRWLRLATTAEGWAKTDPGNAEKGLGGGMPGSLATGDGTVVA